MAATKYFQMGNMAPMRPNVQAMPSVPMPYPTNPTLSSILNTYLPNYQNLPSLPNLPSIPNVPVPLSNLPAIPSSVTSQPINALNYPSPIPTSNMKLPVPPKNFFDPTVMNNLAIALHLLILTNLLHPQESEAPKPNPPDPNVYPQNSPSPAPTYQPNIVQGYYAEQQDPQPSFTPPNSQFLSSSGFTEPSLSPSLMGPLPGYGNTNQTPRNSYSLMSPYEALGPGPQGKDVFAQYGPQNFKADFQSPYNSIMANDNSSKDLFSMF